MKTSTAWMEQAACRSADAALFFPEPGDDAEPGKRICRDCPVQQQCWSGAQPHGIWAGTTPKERAALNRKILRTAAAA